ncbi:sushi, von Willebrand factor type A, EGF and pentraxin domain-containing protein 1 [Genypterus blacodes]|uniref:sushi, von Willebrand factor type A, EGF and pentraxin domain-containing protein 1 n=1 Tax=Genypterus blacodes TaxID=154954 RepID=UPI003F76536F
MDKTNTGIILLFLLSAIADAQMMGPTLDVCATCHADAMCEEKFDGSGKVCNCKYGFVGNGRTSCHDKDECQIGASRICGQHTTCHNTYGSYYCTCLSGYSPSNNLDVFIPNDGSHCQDDDECRIPGLCGEGGQCQNLDGSFECRCQPGYRVHNGAESFHPQTDGASCKVVDCGLPPSVPGSVLYRDTDTSYGSEATFGCCDGFLWRRGDNTSVCGADGLWRGPTIVCEEVDCGSPPALPHSHMLWNKSSAMGAEVVYQCDPGYRNVGEGDVSACTDAGLWTPPSVLCQEILCGIPPLIKATEQVWNGGSAPSSVVLYLCKKGFYIKGGNNVSRCDENGLWTTPTLSCQEILCGDPPTLPDTGQEWNGSSTPGSTVTYYCKEGFNDHGGNHTSLCTFNGYWTKPGISCKEVDCGVPPAVPHSVMLWDQTSAVDSQVVYRCKFGFQSIGEQNASVCTASGRWEGASVLCQEISCSPPLTPPHTNVLWERGGGGGGSRAGSVLLYECAEGFYQNSGNARSTCSLSGEWGEVSITCKGRVTTSSHSAEGQMEILVMFGFLHFALWLFLVWRSSHDHYSNGSFSRYDVTC